MASSRQQRRAIERRQAKEEAKRAAERAAKRRRLLLIALPLAAALVLAAIVWASTRGDGETVAAGDGNGESSDAEGGAAGKACVEVSEPLPDGAPDVPVEKGPPPDELKTEDLKPGDGEEVQAGDTVTAHYIGVSCSTGKVFDSSWSRGEPAEFSLGQVIEGWQEGLPGMKVGGRRLLVIPPAKGYGETGSPPDIAPNETLYFVVDMVATKRA